VAGLVDGDAAAGGPFRRGVGDVGDLELKLAWPGAFTAKGAVEDVGFLGEGGGDGQPQQRDDRQGEEPGQPQHGGSTTEPKAT